MHRNARIQDFLAEQTNMPAFVKTLRAPSEKLRARDARKKLPVLKHNVRKAPLRLPKLPKDMYEQSGLHPCFTVSEEAVAAEPVTATVCGQRSQKFFAHPPVVPRPTLLQARTPLSKRVMKGPEEGLGSLPDLTPGPGESEAAASAPEDVAGNFYGGYAAGLTCSEFKEKGDVASPLPEEAQMSETVDGSHKAGETLNLQETVEVQEETSGATDGSLYLGDSYGVQVDGDLSFTEKAEDFEPARQPAAEPEAVANERSLDDAKAKRKKRIAVVAWNRRMGKSREASHRGKHQRLRNLRFCCLCISCFSEIEELHPVNALHLHSPRLMAPRLHVETQSRMQCQPEPKDL